MHLLQAIGEWLEGLEVGVLGADLFLGERPSRPVGVVAVYLEGGHAPDVYRPCERVTLRCLARAETAAEALERAEALADLLHGRENVALGEGWWCYLCHVSRRPALTTPSRAERADAGAVAECGFVLNVRRMG